MVILISLVALGAGKFPCCKPDEGNRVAFRSASSHVLTENYSVIAFRVFAGDAIISLYGHVGHLPAREKATAMIPSQQAPPRPLSFCRTIKLSIAAAIAGLLAVNIAKTQSITL